MTRTVTRAVVFDFNGTLSDDEPILCDIFVQLFAEHGKPLSAQEYFDQLAGLSDPEIVRTWLGRDHPDVNAVIVSFEAGAIALVRQLRPRMRTVQHVAFVPMRVAAARGCWAVGMENARATPRAFARAERLGLATTVYTVNEPERMRELARLAVTGIFSDRPDLALRTLRG